MPIIKRKIKEPGTSVELDKEEILELTLSSGTIWKMEVVATGRGSGDTNRFLPLRFRTSGSCPRASINHAADPR